LGVWRIAPDRPVPGLGESVVLDGVELLTEGVLGRGGDVQREGTKLAIPFLEVVRRRDPFVTEAGMVDSRSPDLAPIVRPLSAGVAAVEATTPCRGPLESGSTDLAPTGFR